MKNLSIQEAVKIFVNNTQDGKCPICTYLFTSKRSVYRNIHCNHLICEVCLINLENKCQNCNGGGKYEKDELITTLTRSPQIVVIKFVDKNGKSSTLQIDESHNFQQLLKRINSGLNISAAALKIRDKVYKLSQHKNMKILYFNLNPYEEIIQCDIQNNQMVIQFMKCTLQSMKARLLAQQRLFEINGWELQKQKEYIWIVNKQNTKLKIVINQGFPIRVPDFYVVDAQMAQLQQMEWRPADNLLKICEVSYQNKKSIKQLQQLNKKLQQFKMLTELLTLSTSNEKQRNNAMKEQKCTIM